MNNQEIVQTRDAKHPAARDHQQPDANLTPYVLRRWPSVVAASVLAALAGGGTWGLWLASGKILDVAASWNFFAQNTLSLFIVLGVVAQALIYMSQRKVMYEQWQAMQDALKIERAKIAPRLRIEEVHAAGFEIGQSPAFIVTLVNEGATDAQGVALYVQAKRGGLHTEWRGEQIVTIPANGRKDYPIRWSAVLNQEVIDAYNSEPRLKVFGYFTYRDIKQSFCYHYYPWIGKRPPELPYFVPCDFDVHTDVVVSAESIQLKLSAYAPDVITQPKPPEEQDD